MTRCIELQYRQLAIQHGWTWITSSLLQFFLALYNLLSGAPGFPLRKYGTLIRCSRFYQRYENTSAEFLSKLTWWKVDILDSWQIRDALLIVLCTNSFHFVNSYNIKLRGLLHCTPVYTLFAKRLPMFFYWQKAPCIIQFFFIKLPTKFII